MYRESPKSDDDGQFSNLCTMLKFVLAVGALVLCAYELNAACLYPTLTSWGINPTLY